MTDTTASDSSTRSCPNCGAPEMTFDPSSGGLLCQYCNHREAAQVQVPAAQAPAAPAPTQTAPVQAPGQAQAPAAVAPNQENSLQSGFQLEQGQGGGFGLAVREIECQTCGARVALSEGTTSSSCDFCGSPQVLEQSQNRNIIRPQGLVPFQIDRNSAQSQFRDWLGGFFRPGDLKQKASLGEIGGVYVPYWTYDADVATRWQAEAGYYYYETVTKVVDVDGKKQTQQVQERRTRWERASGHRQDHYDDVLVPASGGLDEKLAMKLGTFDTSQLQPYSPDFISGFKAEEYALSLRDGWPKAQQQIDRSQHDRCARDVPGDTHRSLEMQHQFSRETYKHILLPIWIASYRYNDKLYRFLVNGQTGEVQGEAPISWIKVALVVFLVIGAIAAIYFMTQR